MSNLNTPSAFSLHQESSDSDFHSRTNDIFGNLNNLEARHNEVVKAREDNKSDLGEAESLMKSDPNEEDIESDTSAFKKPNNAKFQRRPDRKRRHDDQKSIPEYLTHPEKWKKYTLSDVTSDQMSAASNSRAAFAFLQELRQNHEKEIEDEKLTEAEVKDRACSKGLFTFRQPGSSSQKSETNKGIRSCTTLDSDDKQGFDDDQRGLGNNKEGCVDNKRDFGDNKDSHSGRANVNIIASGSSDTSTDNDNLTARREDAKHETTKTEFKSRKSGTKRQIRKREDDQENSD